MLQLYRVYNLASVIHENLRPEKPPRPFTHGEEDEPDEDGFASRGESISPRTRRAMRKEGSWKLFLCYILLITFH